MSLGFFSGSIFRSGLFEYTPRRVYTFFIIGLRYVILPVRIHIRKVMCNRQPMF